MHIVYPAVVSALLFSIGVYGVLARRNTILVLMSVELMLNAVNLNLVAFDVWLGDRLHSGQVLTLFVIVIAAAEVGLGLAIVLALFRNRQTIDIDRLRALTEPVLDPTGTPTSSAALDPAETPSGSAGSSPRPESAPASAPGVVSRRPDVAKASDKPSGASDDQPAHPAERGAQADQLAERGAQPVQPVERGAQADQLAERGARADQSAERGARADQPVERGPQDQSPERLPEDSEHRVNRGGGDR